MHTGLQTSTVAGLILTPLLVCNSARAQAPIDPDQHFVGTTPCDTQPRRFLGIVKDLPCERITWQLALSTDRETGLPATFSLVAVYGMQAQSAPGFVDGGRTVQRHGAWSVVTGIAANGNDVYRLAAKGPARSANFARIGGNLLHLLDDANRLAIGNPSWSYTLNRVSGATSRAVSGPLTPTKISSARPRPAAVFEGRSPCQEIAQLLNVRTGSECNKIKWRLTLFEDPTSGVPTTYRLEGTLYRDRPRTGTWAILEDRSAGSRVFRLDPDHPAGSLSLLKGDDNVLFFLTNAGTFLVGDAEFSYTLNQVSSR